MESLKERLNEDMKAAMKAREAGKDRLAVIRMVRSAIRQTEIDGKTTLDDDGVMAVISKELKQRRDSLAEFQKGGRDDLVAKAEAEIAILTAYLPEQLTKDELVAIIKEIIDQTGAATPKDMGKVMGKLMPRIKGRADGKQASDLVKEMLNG